MNKRLKILLVIVVTLLIGFIIYKITEYVKDSAYVKLEIMQKNQ